MATNAELIALFGDDFQETLETLEEQFPDEIDTIIDEIVTLMIFDSHILKSLLLALHHHTPSYKIR